MVLLTVLLLIVDLNYGRGLSSNLKHKPKWRYFDQGGFKKYAGKITTAMYVEKQMTRCVKFRPNEKKARSIPWTWRANIYCYDCISINGSNPGCESMSNSSLPTCRTSYSKGYCSVEYGVLSNDQSFVRRTCQDRRCRPCSSDDKIPGACRTFQCDLCNWRKCNKDDVREVFSNGWKGCIPYRDRESYKFDREPYKFNREHTRKTTEKTRINFDWRAGLVGLVLSICCCCGCCKSKKGIDKTLQARKQQQHDTVQYVSTNNCVKSARGS